MNSDWLIGKSQIKEKPLQSNAPLIGPVIAKFRNLWGSVAAKWMIHHVVTQQNEFNSLTAIQLQTLDARVIEQDHDLVALTRQVAELNVTMHQLQKQIQKIDEQIAELTDFN